MKISVIMPVYNEEKDILGCLVSLKEQTYNDFEIVIVDDGSTDNTKKIVENFKKHYKNVSLIEGKHKGPGFSRNLGVKLAIGEILVFVDADMTFDKDYIAKLISPIITDKKVIGTTHELELVKNTKNVWSHCWGRVRVSKEEAKEIKIFRAIKKNDFLKMGGFSPKYGYADDQTFWFKFKIKPLVAPGTICYHKNPESLKGVYNQSRWIGASIDNKIFEIPILNYLVPFILLFLFPIAIPLLSVKKSYKNKELILLFPWMLVFMTARYFGTVFGVANRIYQNSNVK